MLAATGCPVIIAQSVHLTYYSDSGNNYGTPCSWMPIILSGGMRALTRFLALQGLNSIFKNKLCVNSFLFLFQFVLVVRKKES